MSLISSANIASMLLFVDDVVVLFDDWKITFEKLGALLVVVNHKHTFDFFFDGALQFVNDKRLVFDACKLAFELLEVDLVDVSLFNVKMLLLDN